MFCVIPIILLVSNALALPTTEKTFYDLADAEYHFSDFIQKYDKHYETEEEYNTRLEIFKSNLIRSNNLNKIHEARFGVNIFADLTHEEFSKTHLGCVPPQATNTTIKVTVKKEWILNAPDSLDYRDQNLVTPVKNQGSCGSCYVFSAIGNIEGQYAKKHKELVSLSEQQGLDCDTEDYGCGGGIMVHVMTALSNAGGSQIEEDYPYEAVAKDCRTDSNKIKVKVTGGHEISTPTEEELKAAVAQYGPLSVALHMPSNQLYNGGVLSPSDCSGDADHAILIVGYGTDSASGKDFWLIKNSWGASWGEQGYFRLEKGKQYCKIGEVFTASAEVA